MTSREKPSAAELTELGVSVVKAAQLYGDAEIDYRARMLGPGVTVNSEEHKAHMRAYDKMERLLTQLTRASVKYAEAIQAAKEPT